MKCENCMHNAVCEQLEEFRDPLGWTNTKGEFVCSYYTNASEIAERVIDEMVKALKKFVDNDVSLHSPLPCCSVLWHFTDGIEQIESRLKKKYMEGKDV